MAGDEGHREHGLAGLQADGRPADLSEIPPAPSLRTQAGLALLHPSLGWAQGLVEGRGFPGCCCPFPWPLHGPLSPPHPSQCPAQPFLPSLSPGLCLCHPPQEGPQAARWFIHKSQEPPCRSCSSPPCGQFTARLGGAVQPSPVPSWGTWIGRNRGLILLRNVVLQSWVLPRLR